MAVADKKLLLITGAGRGIGAATAKLAASRGYKVCVNFVNNSITAENVVNEIIDQGGEAFSFQADVSNEAEVDLLFTELDKHGKISALVNNVGILAKQGRLEDMNIERIKNVLNTNILSTILCTQAAIKRMSVKHGGSGGAIVNVSSSAAKSGSGNEYVDYAASKGAIDSFTIGMAKELADDGIRVNCVRPALIYTDIHALGGEPGRVDRMKENVPLKRGGTVEEVAYAILWLLSDEATYSTGAFLDVTGGR